MAAARMRAVIAIWWKPSRLSTGWGRASGRWQLFALLRPLTVQSEAMQAVIVRGERVDEEELTRLTNAQSRALRERNSLLTAPRLLSFLVRAVVTGIRQARNVEFDRSPHLSHPAAIPILSEPIICRDGNVHSATLSAMRIGKVRPAAPLSGDREWPQRHYATMTPSNWRCSKQAIWPLDRLFLHQPEVMLRVLVKVLDFD
jgi:hypothetical protein